MYYFNLKDNILKFVTNHIKSFVIYILFFFASHDLISYNRRNKFELISDVFRYKNT